MVEKRWYEGGDGDDGDEVAVNLQCEVRALYHLLGTYLVVVVDLAAVKPHNQPQRLVAALVII